MQCNRGHYPPGPYHNTIQWGNFEISIDRIEAKCCKNICPLYTLSTTNRTKTALSNTGLRSEKHYSNTVCIITYLVFQRGCTYADHYILKF